jgi:hypothetical protein
MAERFCALALRRLGRRLRRKIGAAGRRLRLNDGVNTRGSFLRNFLRDARRRIGWILDPPRRSFEHGAFLDRQRAMKNIALHGRAILEPDADRTNRALDVSAYRHLLGNDVALDLCAFAEQEIGDAKLALDATEDPRLAGADDMDSGLVTGLVISSGLGIGSGRAGCSAPERCGCAPVAKKLGGPEPAGP